MDSAEQRRFAASADVQFDPTSPDESLGVRIIEALVEAEVGRSSGTARSA